MHKIESHFLVASKEVINIINNIYYVVRLVSSLQLLVKYEVLLIFRRRSFLSLDLNFIFSLIFDSTTTLVFISIAWWDPQASDHLTENSDACGEDPMIKDKMGQLLDGSL